MTGSTSEEIRGLPEVGHFIENVAAGTAGISALGFEEYINHYDVNDDHLLSRLQISI